MNQQQQNHHLGGKAAEATKNDSKYALIFWKKTFMYNRLIQQMIIIGNPSSINSSKMIKT